MSNAGRPTKFQPWMLHIASKLYEKGAPDTQVADILDVTEKTLHNWKKNHPEFLQCSKVTKEKVDDFVESALLKRALGFTQTVEKLDKHGDLREMVEVVPPDPKSCQLWLNSRRKEEWTQTKETKHDVSEGLQVILNTGSKTVTDETD